MFPLNHNAPLFLTDSVCIFSHRVLEFICSESRLLSFGNISWENYCNACIKAENYVDPDLSKYLNVCVFRSWLFSALKNVTIIISIAFDVRACTLNLRGNICRVGDSYREFECPLLNCHCSTASLALSFKITIVEII